MIKHGYNSPFYPHCSVLVSEFTCRAFNTQVSEHRCCRHCCTVLFYTAVGEVVTRSLFCSRKAALERKRRSSSYHQIANVFSSCRLQWNRL